MCGQCRSERTSAVGVFSPPWVGTARLARRSSVSNRDVTLQSHTNGPARSSCCVSRRNSEVQRLRQRILIPSEVEPGRESDRRSDVRGKSLPGVLAVGQQQERLHNLSRPRGITVQRNRAGSLLVQPANGLQYIVDCRGCGVAPYGIALERSQHKAEQDQIQGFKKAFKTESDDARYWFCPFCDVR